MGTFNRRHGPAKQRTTHSPVGESSAISGLPWGEARDGEQEQTFDIAPGAVDGNVNILAGSLGMNLFASTIVPPRVLGTLPTLPDTVYPIGSLVFLTTNGKLYRNYANVWTVATDGADIVTDSITAGQISAGAIGTSELSATAVIANVINAGGTVTIDSTGIKIIDLAGSTVLTSAGFGGSWVGYIRTGVYNSDFGAGTLVATTAATIVGTASTEADYMASLSAKIPMWIVGEESGTGSLIRAVDTAAPSGFALRWQNAETASVIQDVYMSPGVRPSVSYLSRWTGGTTTTVEVFGSYRDVNHAIIGSEETLSSGGLVATRAVYEYDGVGTVMAAVAPLNARFFRVRFRIVRTGTSDFYLGGIQVDRSLPSLLIQQPMGTSPQGLEVVGTAAALVRLGAVHGTWDLDIGGSGVTWAVTNEQLLKLADGVLVMNNASLAMSSVISPAQITATTNNYAPTDGRKSYMWRLSSDATVRSITGINSGNTHGERHLLVNLNGSTAMTLAHDSASSTAGNRFYCPNSAAFSLLPNAAVEVVYDNTSSRWRVMQS